MRIAPVAWCLAGLTFAVALACETTEADPDGAAAPGAQDGGGGPSLQDASSSSGSSGSSGSAALGDSSADSSSVLADASPKDAGPPFVYRDINHVLGTGQSLSVGAVGSPALSTEQPFENLMFNTGAIAGGANLTSFVPLIEINNETLSSSLANMISQLAHDNVFAAEPAATRDHDVLISGHGIGGTAYSGLKKGTGAYANGMAQVTAAKDLAAKQGKSYVVRAITNVHGESDHIAANTAYAANIVEWQQDYQKDVRAITGQADLVPMLHTQMSSWTMFSGSTTSRIPIDQLEMHIAHPGETILVGPKYHLAYVADGVHLSNAGYRHMGEDYAKVYRRVILERGVWEPVRPIKVTRVGATITIKFAVPAPPLVLDDEEVSNPGNFGFEFAETGGTTPTIEDVEVTGADTVRITLTEAPTGANKRIRYAFTGVGGANGGPKTGPRGNLRDSDLTPSRYDFPLFNWCVHFDEAVP